RNSFSQQRLVLRHQNPRWCHLDTHALQAAQEGDESLGVVRGEHAADFETPQCGCSDLDRYAGVAVELARHALEWLALKHDLPVQPGGSPLRLDSRGRSGPFAAAYLNLLIGAKLNKSRRSLRARGGSPRYRGGSDGDAPFDHRDD